ncbi:FkbM family methyltransferase [Chlamydiales bacterium]|nr:FkbM family methyltransferase [Chlamydiales bacterium]
MIICSCVIFIFNDLTAARANSILTIKKNAASLSDQGLNRLYPLIDDEMKNIYLSDQENIYQFPHVKYRIATVKGQGKFYIDDVNDVIKKCLYKGRIWESSNQKLIKKYVKPGTVAIDIGSHIGTHTLTMSKSVKPRGTVIAFEPSRKIYYELCMNLTLNNCHNVCPVRCAIGKTKGVAQVIESCKGNEGGSYMVEDISGDNIAALLPLDDFQLTNVSFIKIDVENMELEVLEGAVKTIQGNRPIMLIEIQGNKERPLQLNENSEIMKQRSLDKIIQLDYKIVPIDKSDDYLAFPN